MTPVGPPAVRLKGLIEEAAQRLGADPAGAESQARLVLSHDPGDPRARLILASARRRQGDTHEASTLLEPLARQFPRAPRTWFELGLTRQGLGDRPGAVAALTRAVEIDADLETAWKALGDLAFEAGELDAAEAAYAQHGRASVKEPMLRPAAEALASRRWSLAEQLLTQRLVTGPADAQTLKMLGEALNGLERYAEAEAALRRCLDLDPALSGARFSYATALFHQQKGPEAVQALGLLLTDDPEDPAVLNLYAGCLSLLSEHHQAAEIYTQLIGRFPGHARIWLNYGHALRTIGRGREAVNAYRRSIALAPQLGDAYWGLANLKTVSLAQEQKAIRSLLARADLGADDRTHLLYALGKALEDQEAWEDSFSCYAAGARLRRATLQYDRGSLEDRFRRIRQVFTPEFFEARRGWGVATPEPIFIVGLPRAGSTLVEQILASHSRVEGTMELPDLGALVRRLDGAAGPAISSYPEGLANLCAEDVRALGTEYLERVARHRRQAKAFFIDKMPNNFEHIGLIRLILPGARIIDARRHPVASCFAAFKQLFAQGQTFSYDFGDLAHYYEAYVRLMMTFDEIAPNTVHRLVYEDLIAHPEGEVSRLLQACGLEFEDQCLRFYENGRPVRTVSSEQVRTPLYTAAVDRWRSYQPWLGPLEQALQPSLSLWRR